MGAAKALGAFLRLPPGDRTMALEATLALLLAQLLVEHVPMRRWRRLLHTDLEPLPSAGSADRPTANSGGGGQGREADVPRTVAAAVRRVERRCPFRTRCLGRAMAVQWMLRRRGIPSRLVFGVRRGEPPEQALQFHAWLTVGGVCVVGAREVGSFAALAPPGADGRASVRRERRDVTPPFAGLLAALRRALATGEREADGALLAGVGDWRAVADLARRHRVHSLLLRGARGVDVGPEGQAVLAQLRQRTVPAGLRQLAGLGRAADCLTGAGVPFLVLKGLPLSARLFGTPLARDCYDIDLLVPPDAVGDAERALAFAGWERRKPSFRPTPARVRRYDRFVKDRLFVGPGGALELHHRLFSNPFLLPAPFDSLRANAVEVQVGDRRLPALGDEDLFAYLAMHGQLHRWARLKWLCDVAALSRSMRAGRCAAAAERCRQSGARPERAFGTAMLLCRELLRAEIPIAPGRAADGRPVARAADRTRRLWNTPGGCRGLRGIPRVFDESRIALGLRPCWRVLAHELARPWVTPYDLDRVDLPDRLLFLYAPLRPFLYAAGRLRRRRATRRSRSPSASS